MNYLKLPFMDESVSIFSICQAHAQLESDYNKGGWLVERPSNQRRMASTGVQLSRMKYSNPYGWVDILSDEEIDGDENDVRDIYLLNVLKWGLPMDDEMKAFIGERWVHDWLDKQFPDWRTR